MNLTTSSGALPHCTPQSFKIFLIACILLVLLPAYCICADEASPVDEQDMFQKRRDIAVALNYCRASFHRIRKYPNEQVMREEEEKILNNLNLNGIKNAEIIRLYTEVLDEIGQIQLTDKETELYDGKFKRSLRQELAFDSLSVGLDLLTAQYIGAVRTGANSWWDYRNFKWNRDNEVFKLEKTRVNSVVKKSSTFLDTFWKLTQEFEIPDRWLVRSTDLDDLEQAMNEENNETKLRILKRMEPYMECYPPYWYYVARTQQAIGNLSASLNSYEVLAELGTQHFRRDDMLASAFANQAVIQAHFGQPEAVQTARKALAFSTEVWEANLTCARILQQSGQLADAEDAILRNLDVGLEEDRSSVTLLTFYYDTNNTKQLAHYLADEKMLAKVPPPVLIRFASRLNEEETPSQIWTALVSSMRIYPQVGFGSDDVLLACHPVWKIERSKLILEREDGTQVQGEYYRQGDFDVVRFAKVADFGSVLTGPSKLPRLKLQLSYGETDPIHLAFSNEALPGENVTAQTTGSTRNSGDTHAYHLIAAQWGERGIAYVPNFPRTASLYEPINFNPTASTFGQNANGEIKSASQNEEAVPDEADTKIR